MQEQLETKKSYLDTQTLAAMTAINFTIIFKGKRERSTRQLPHRIYILNAKGEVEPTFPQPLKTHLSLARIKALSGFKVLINLEVVVFGCLFLLNH